MTDLIVELRKKLHGIPEKSMHEVQTKKMLMDFIKEHTGSLKVIDRGNWFYAVKKADKKGNGKCIRPIAFRSDYDAVTCADGIPRHLCGHDGHSATLAGLALWLDGVSVKRDVYLIFQPGEETGEGGKICASLIDEAGIGEIYGFHNIPGYEIGTVLLLKDTFACASTGLEIKFTGKQSHAAYPDKGVNPSLAIAHVIQCMDGEIHKAHKGIVLGTVIGIEAGSRSYGVSAGEGKLRLTLRAQHQDEYDAFVDKIENVAVREAKNSGLAVNISRIEEFPATVNHEECVLKAEKLARELGMSCTYPDEPFRWSEDFGYYLQKTKGAYIGIGCGITHPDLHTMEYEFEDGIIETVIEIYKSFIKTC